MSIKRQATTQLTHENWDQEDPDEKEEMGTFKTASKDVLEKRVMRTAKRRTQISGDEGKKSVFSAFGGFNKTQPSSFDFLKNLTNGNKANGGQDEASPTQSLFGTKPLSNTSSGFFNMPMSSSAPIKPAFGISTSQTPLFGTSTSVTTAANSPFSVSKTDSSLGGGTPFKMTTSPVAANTDSLLKNTNQTPVLATGVFGTSFSNTNTNSSLFSAANTPTTSFKSQTNTNIDTTPTNNLSNASPKSNDSEKKTEEKTDEKKMKYYSKLKGLNESVSDWIKKHVEATPLCILTPIFRDYDNHLKEIQAEYHGDDSKKPSEKESSETKSESETKSTKTESETKSSPASSLFSTSSSTLKPQVFSIQNTNTTPEKQTGFTFGIKTPTTSATSVTTVGGFSFGVNTPSTSTSGNTSSSPFALGTNTTINSSTPFSFGIGKPFSFSPNVQTSAEPTKTKEEDDDEPPKVEFTPVVEENSVFEKRCKIFVKKDGNFVDKGVGTLYVKKIEETGKHQLLVRANTNLGNILLNLILTTGTPTQRLGKNNVMLVCIPSPDAKPPPIPVLIRVKTSEEADNLLETLEKFKA